MCRHEPVDPERPIEPFLPRLDRVVEFAPDPYGAPLRPVPVVAAEQCAVVSNAGIDRAVGVEGMAVPKRKHVIEQRGAVKIEQFREV
jgi:hypothetical protein